MTSARTVQRLKIRGADRAAVRHAGLLLEDALRTASLPGEGAELLLVRRMRLPAFRADATAQSVARSLEEHYRQHAHGIVIGETSDEQTLDTADRVRFRDSLSAHLVLTLKLCRNETLYAWCWPLLIEGFHRDLHRHTAMRALARSLQQLPEAAVALPRWFATLVEHDIASAFIERLSHDDALQLTMSASAYSPMPAPTGSPPQHAAPRWRSLLGWVLHHYAEHDPRRIWVNTMARANRVPLRTAQAQGQVQVQAQAQAQAHAQRQVTTQSGAQPADNTDPRVEPMHSDPDRIETHELASQDAGAFDQRDDGGQSAHVAQHATAPIQENQTPPLVERRARAALADAEVVDQQPVEHAASRGPQADALREQAPATAMQASDAQPTAAGGILFLLPVLEALGLPDWLEAHREWSAATVYAALLQVLLKRLRIPQDDVAWTLAALPQEPCADGFIVPAHWQGRLFRGRLCISQLPAGSLISDAGQRVPLGCLRVDADNVAAALSAVGWLTAESADALRVCCTKRWANATGIDLLGEAWLGATRRWLRRRVGIGLADLVHRPARLLLTPTHMEMHLSLDQVNLPARRAGLDIDPGWLPWLGRVVSFRFDDRADWGTR